MTVSIPKKMLLWMRVLPDEISAVGAVGGLSQVGGHELVPVDLMDSPPDGPLALSGTHPLTKHPLLIFIGWCSCCIKWHGKICWFLVYLLLIIFRFYLNISQHLATLIYDIWISLYYICIAKDFYFYYIWILHLSKNPGKNV